MVFDSAASKRRSNVKAWKRKETFKNPAGTAEELKRRNGPESAFRLQRDIMGKDLEHGVLTHNAHI